MVEIEDSLQTVKLALLFCNHVNAFCWYQLGRYRWLTSIFFISKLFDSALKLLIRGCSTYTKF